VLRVKPDGLVVVLYRTFVLAKRAVRVASAVVAEGLEIEARDVSGYLKNVHQS
jgi:hypothetical protein